MLDNGVESSSEGIHRIHRTRYDSDGKGPCSIRGRLRKSSPMLDEGVESLRCYPSDPSDTNRLRWKSLCSICEILEKTSPMLA